MARLYLPLGVAIKNPQTERQAIIQRLRQLNYPYIIGSDDPNITEISELRDHLAKAEHQARNPVPEIVIPSRFTKKEIAEALKDVKRFSDERKAGRRRFY